MRNSVLSLSTLLLRQSPTEPVVRLLTAGPSCLPLDNSGLIGMLGSCFGSEC